MERPRAQIDYYARGGSRPIIYGLGNRGAKLLEERGGKRIKRPRWNEKNQSVGRIFLEHALLVSDVMVSLERSTRTVANVKLISAHDLDRNTDKLGKTSRWRVKINATTKLGVVPDQVFALETQDGHGTRTRAYFFLEADRGTMPVVRKNLLQTSFYRKLLAYQKTWAQGLHRSLFAFHRFRVIVVTKSAERVRSLVEACAKLDTGHGLFLFCDAATFFEHENIFDIPWITGNGAQSKLLP